MKSTHCPAQEALRRLRSVRKSASPNDGFMSQLKLFEDWNYQASKDDPLYRQWKQGHLKRTSQPSFTKLTVSKSGDYQIRCKRCRCTLAAQSFVICHDPVSKKIQFPTASSKIIGPTCGHYFVELLEWMESEVNRGELEGKLSCPSCKTKVGAYHWQGMTCTCAQWVTPAFALQRAKVDEM